jgi:hypothetical protein
MGTIIGSLSLVFAHAPVKDHRRAGSRLLLGACVPPTEEARPSASATELPPEPCRSTEVGSLDHTLINEASGLEVSSRFPDRAYHINDSGDTARFFLTDLAGGSIQTVAIEGFEPFDTEDVTLGEFGPNRSCLFIADFGDNATVRQEVRIVIIEEQEGFGSSVKPLDIVRFRYSEGPVDAESIAFHPSGDLVIITKEVDFSTRSAFPSRVFKLSKSQWQNTGGGVQTATLVGTLDFAALTADPFSGQIPTAMDIASDGSRFLVLSYVDAFEFYFDVLGELKPAAEMIPGVDYREIDIELLEQQEAVAYLPGTDAFLYDTEFVTRRAVAGPPVAGRARVMRVDCTLR